MYASNIHFQITGSLIRNIGRRDHHNHVLYHKTGEIKAVIVRYSRLITVPSLGRWQRRKAHISVQYTNAVFPRASACLITAATTRFIWQLIKF